MRGERWFEHSSTGHTGLPTGAMQIGDYALASAANFVSLVGHPDGSWRFHARCKSNFGGAPHEVDT